MKRIRLDLETAEESAVTDENNEIMDDEKDAALPSNTVSISTSSVSENVVEVAKTSSVSFVRIFCETCFLLRLDFFSFFFLLRTDIIGRAEGTNVA